MAEKLIEDKGKGGVLHGLKYEVVRKLLSNTYKPASRLGLSL